MDRNIKIRTEDGLIKTNDDLLNRIIRTAEKEMGGQLATAIPAVTFDGEDPSEKFYIVLLTYYDETTGNDWEIMQGRQETYDKLKFLIKEEMIDPNRSFIIGCDQEQCSHHIDAIPVTKPITIFRFMKVMFENGRILDDSSEFDINEFDPCDENGDKTIIEI